MLGGVMPQTMKDKLDCLSAQPMQPRKRQKPCDVGLFDTESRKQMELFAPYITSGYSARTLVACGCRDQQ
jgi:hypothetical protein